MGWSKCQADDMFGKDCGRHGTRYLSSKKTWRNQISPRGDESAFSGSKLRLVSFESYLSNQSHDCQVSMKLNNGLYKPEVSWREIFSGFLAIWPLFFSQAGLPVDALEPGNRWPTCCCCWRCCRCCGGVAAHHFFQSFVCLENLELKTDA